MNTPNEIKRKRTALRRIRAVNDTLDGRGIIFGGCLRDIDLKASIKDIDIIVDSEDVSAVILAFIEDGYTASIKPPSAGYKVNSEINAVYGLFKAGYYEIDLIVPTSLSCEDYLASCPIDTSIIAMDIQGDVYCNKRYEDARANKKLAITHTQVVSEHYAHRMVDKLPSDWEIYYAGRLVSNRKSSW